MISAWNFEPQDCVFDYHSTNPIQMQWTHIVYTLLELGHDIDLTVRFSCNFIFTVWIDSNFVKWKYHEILIMHSYLPPDCMSLFRLLFRCPLAHIVIAQYIYSIAITFLQKSLFSEVKKIKLETLDTASTKNKPSHQNIKPKQPTTGLSAESSNQKGSNVNTCHPSTSQSKQPVEFGHLQNASRQPYPSTTFQPLFILQPPVMESKPLIQTTYYPTLFTISDSKATPMLNRQLSVSGTSSNIFTYNCCKIQM